MAFLLTIKLYKDSFTEVFGLKNQIIWGFWAVLSLRVRVHVEGVVVL